MIFHTYLLRMMKIYGYSMKFITSIQTTWYKTFFSPQINSYFVGPFPTRCSITQIRPMSNISFPSILNPLICVCQGGITLDSSNYREITVLGFRLSSTVALSRNVNGCGQMQGKFPGDSPEGTGTMSKILNTVCANLITLQDMTHKTDFRNPD